MTDRITTKSLNAVFIELGTIELNLNQIETAGERSSVGFADEDNVGDVFAGLTVNLSLR